MKVILIICFALTAGTVVLSAQADSAGIKLLEQRKFSEANLFFRNAVKNNGSDAEARYFLARTLMILGEFDEAEDEIDEAIELNENVAKYHLVRGQILGQQAMNANFLSQGLLAPKIKNAFLRASELDPNNIEAHVSLYNYYIMAPGILGGSEDKAVEEINAVERLDVFRSHLLRAGYYIRKKDSVKAETEMKKAIASNPTKTAGYKQLGYFYLNRQQFTEAYEQMKKYTELEPKNPDSYDSFADVLKAEKKFDEAIEKYLYALSIDKTFSPSIFSLGECYEGKGEKLKAKETYQWFLKVEPKGRRAETAKKKLEQL